MFAALEGFEGFLIVAFDPARLVDRDRLPAAFGAVLVFQAVLDHLELQRADRTDDAPDEGAEKVKSV